MSRSRHNGCGGTCGVCQPHKKWPSTYEPKPSDRRRMPPADVDAPGLRHYDEWAAKEEKI